MSRPAPDRFLRERLPWIVALLAVLALVATMVLSRRGEGSDAAVGATVTPSAPVAAPAVAVDQGAEGATRAGARAAALADTASTSTTPAQAAAERERQLRDLEAAFAADAPDGAGSARVEAVLERTLAGATMAGTGLVPEDVDVACRRGSCRIVASLGSQGNAQDWGLFLVTTAGGDVLAQSQMVFLPMPDGRTEVRIFASRSRD